MRKIIIKLEKPQQSVIEQAVKLGFSSFLVDKKLEEKLRGEGLTAYVDNGDRTLVTEEGRKRIPIIEIKSPDDLEKVVELARMGVDEVHVKARDWRIIPLENLIAMKRGVNLTVVAEAESPEELELLFGILEKGVDGAVVKVEQQEELTLLRDVVKAPRELHLHGAAVTEVRDVGMGDRVCVDTVSMLELGEGLLVGSMARMFFLIHNEAVGSAFTSPRPFRVNAGAVHNYILMPDGRTRYLSEISAGDRVLVVDKMGRTRVTAVGRAKVERRPMRLVKARIGENEGAVIVQNAETIRFITPDGELIPVTELKKGDTILCHPSEEKGRHFGMAVEETIIEK
ncbi:MAG TPA: 3-dehydroquinate synthase [Candidatus Caldiarchaeum subterraneum]|uniref:3-dehydroquinate synthase n=1 Tax=Caldiarchaeum subterraneum TaxID=311458 RepID=A0A832ZYL2_CALS0|nr:3-dehydroquinate synthase [Candidatus Caldarchaeum subterraneum]